MSMTRHTLVPCLFLALCIYGVSGCTGVATDPANTAARPPEGDVPQSKLRSLGGVVLGEPVAVTRDFDGNLLIADRAPGQVVHLMLGPATAVEFDQPPTATGFFPSDVKSSGFYVYVTDPGERQVLRFYKTGAYLDVLIDLEARFPGRYVTPAALAVDGSGRVAVADVKNHEVIVFNPYLDVELQFGSYGRFEGQFDSPEGVSFGKKDVIVVTDSGNRRVQIFDPDGGFVRMVPANGEPSSMRRPRRCVMDGKGWLYVADPEAGSVFVFDETGALQRRIAPAGVAKFRPMGVAVAPDGAIFVTDQATSSPYTFH